VNTKRLKELIEANEKLAKAGNKLAEKEVENLKKYNSNPELTDCYLGCAAFILVQILAIVIACLFFK
tara:strand:- start:582 stop:782 length:201 start_codon:yes stop_codon:yes gene_type:complete